MKTYTTAAGDMAYINHAANGNVLVQVLDALTREHALSIASEATTAFGLDGAWVDVQDYNDVSAGWWLTLEPLCDMGPAPKEIEESP